MYLFGSAALFLTFFPVHQKPVKETSALPPVVQTEEFTPCQASRAKETQIKWASANTAVVTGACACLHASGVNWLLKIDCSFLLSLSDTF